MATTLPHALGMLAILLPPILPITITLPFARGTGIPSANCTGKNAYAGTARDGHDYGVDLNQLDLARVKLQFNSDSFPQ